MLRYKLNYPPPQTTPKQSADHKRCVAELRVPGLVPYIFGSSLLGCKLNHPPYKISSHKNHQRCTQKRFSFCCAISLITHYFFISCQSRKRLCFFGELKNHSNHSSNKFKRKSNNGSNPIKSAANNSSTASALFFGGSSCCGYLCIRIFLSPRLLHSNSFSFGFCRATRRKRYNRNQEKKNRH